MEDDPSVGCLDGAKMSLGGSYPDLAVTERTELAKFGLVLIILIPVAFGTTLPMLPDIPVSIDKYNFVGFTLIVPYTNDVKYWFKP